MYWWLSFVDLNKPEGKKHLGCCIIETDDFADAVQLAWENQCNPGGEVAGYPIESLESEHGIELNKLYTTTELRSLGYLSVRELSENN